MGNGLLFPGRFYDDEPEPDECPACGGKPDHPASSCTIEPPRSVSPVEQARRAKRR